ncbi:MAG: filamentous hemagglutinin N-terminal domain-containing protein, partial [Paucibacter sp.]|nr:filamentous hemagglutinin N-terminal domain-containing protein [Roseateles sp.]
MRTPTFKLDRTTLPTSVESLRLSPVCLAALVASGLAGVVPSASATPQGGTVTAGTATILTPKAGQMEIRQGSNAASIAWRSFSIGANESLRIVQPSSQAVLVNRVIGDDPSQILGRLDANGRVFLSNPRGILFGRDAVVDVGGLLATTLAISGVGSQYSLSGGSEAPGSIVVEGQLRAPGGLLAFAGPQITLGGQLEAQRVAAAAVNAVHIDIDGDGLVFFKPRNDEQLDAKLKVLGTIKADGGVVDLRAAARAGLADTVLNMDGLVQARTIGTRNGQVFINGGAVGDTVITGKIDVSGAATGERGGEVRVLGERVELFGSALIDASGAAGGGLVHVGGGFQGQGEPLNASMTVVGARASIQASATDKGDGGQVVVWADGHTTFAGSIEARGGVRGGDGGRVETSGKQTLNFKGQVNTLAPQGKTGTLLLDPSDITISTDANDADDDGLGGFTGSTDSSVLNTTTLQTALATNNVTVDATAGGANGSGSITIVDPVSWSSVRSLTLKASSAITVEAGAGISNAGTG